MFTTRLPHDASQYRTYGAPKTEMIARMSSTCRRCGGPIFAGVTEISKLAGAWGHLACPAPIRERAARPASLPQDDAKLAGALEDAWARHEAELDVKQAIGAELAPLFLEDAEPPVARPVVADGLAIADAADALLEEYARIRRARNLANLKEGTYRVEFSGKADTDAFNLKITADGKVEGAFRFKQAESWQGVGRVHPDGRIVRWATSDLPQAEQDRAEHALEILLGADQLGPFGEAYARESGRCWRCGRELKVEASIERGLGEYCATQVDGGY
jgi:ribosomal protein S14